MAPVNLSADVASVLKRGTVIPAHPLALTAERRFDERHQRALTRYYLAAGAGGVAVGIHTTQFGIRDPSVDLLKPVLEIAPFNRYATLDVIRAVAESGRHDRVALYTGNDDHIVLDLLAPFHVAGHTLRMVGGLLGHWAVWTQRAVTLLDEINAVAVAGQPVSSELLSRANAITDANSAFFDPAHQFAGSIAGLHEVLRRQGLLAGRWCLDATEDLSRGQL